MPDLWESDESNVDDFALPGDDRLIEQLKQDNSADASAEAENAPERPRNEKGQFVKADPEPEAEPEAEAAAEPAVEAAPDTLILGKFKNAEEVINAYTELEKHTGGLRNELGELRRMFEERLNQPAPPPVGAPVAITQDLIDQNPGYAVQLAYEQGNEPALRLAFEQWEDAEPTKAAAWYAQQLVAQERAEMQAQFAQLRAEIQPAAERADTEAFQAGLREYVAEKPDAAEFIQGGHLAALANEFSWARETLERGTPQQQIEAIKSLHAIHRGRNTDNLRVATQEVARATAEEAQREREEAFVASPSGTPGAVKPREADTIAAEWDKLQAPIESGWNVR